MKNNKNIKGVGIVKNDAITGIEYGIVEIITPQNETNDFYTAQYNNAKKRQKEFRAKLRGANTKNK